MSYATELKNAVASKDAQTNCCRKAYVNGFLLVAASRIDEKQIKIVLSGEIAVRTFTALAERVFHTAFEIAPCRGGGDTKEIVFSSSSAARYLTELDDGGEVQALSMRCKECRKWFLRGIFLACAKPSDPSNTLRLDLTPKYRHEQLASFLTDVGLAPLITVRRERKIFYYRSAEKIGDFLAMMGENDAYFALQDEFFKRELNNLTNRQNNCTVSNITRSVKSGGELIDLLMRMKQKNKLSLLPEELKSTAELRLQYRDYTLTQLAAVSVPPLTKSGLNHRLTKILDIARKLDL